MKPNARSNDQVRQSGLKILFTNAFIENWAGSELYIRDLAVELIKRGHKPVVFSPRLGKIAMDFRSKSIPVAGELSAVGEKPDLIHGQHHLETMIALSHFPFTPAVFSVYQSSLDAGQKVTHLILLRTGWHSPINYKISWMIFTGSRSKAAMRLRELIPSRLSWMTSTAEHFGKPMFMWRGYHGCVEFTCG